MSKVEKFETYIGPILMSAVGGVCLLLYKYVDIFNMRFFLILGIICLSISPFAPIISRLEYSLKDKMKKKKSEKTETVHTKEIIKEKEIVIHIKCPYCLKTYQEGPAACPHCGA